MMTNHLSAWEQEEYLLDQRTPQMLRHLSECARCRAGVARLEQGVATFRGAAVEWSTECLASRPQRLQTISGRNLPALRWAIAAALPVLLVLLALLPFRFLSPRPSQPVAQISDDALLDQVDQQLSVAVPSSMESLTHLVSSESSIKSTQGGKQIVDPN